MDAKIIRFLTQFRCIPPNSIAKNIKELSDDEIWKVHREYIEEYNSMVDRYIEYLEKHNVDCSSYIKIKAIA